METTLSASTRDLGRGKTGARKVRGAGQLPAVVYGPNDAPLAITVDPRVLSEIYRKSQNRNTVVELSLDGQNIPCLVREVQRHPVSRELIHVDFYRLAADRKVVVSVPVTTTGKAAGLSLGGRVQIVRREIKVRVDFDKIPTAIEVDVTPMNVGDTVRASGVIAPAGAELVYDQDFPVVTIAGKQKEREEAPAAAAPAEGAAAAAPAKEEKK